MKEAENSDTVRVLEHCCMGIFDSIFGKTHTWSPVEKLVSRQEIRQIVSHFKIPSLTKEEEGIIEGAIDTRRRGDGTISLRQIDETLRQLRRERKLSSDVDRVSVMKVFEKYFHTKFNK